MTEWLIGLRHRLRALLRRRQLEQDLDDEVTFHLAMREEQLRASGAPDAGTGARRQFGSVTRIREDLREAWAFAPRLASLLRDFRYAARQLRRSIAFTSVVVLTLGLGIGANTAFFSVVNAVLIRPLGYADADRLVSLQEGFPQARIDRLPFSALDFEDLRRDQQSFEAVAAYRTVPFEVSGGDLPERIAGAKVSAELFATLGVGTMAGRTFSTSDDRPGVNVVVLSWGLWQRRYAGNPGIVGQSIQLDRQPYTVIGIMPAGFVFPRRGPRFNGEPADVWVPIAFTDRDRAERGSMHNNSVLARLKKDVSFPRRAGRARGARAAHRCELPCRRTRCRFLTPALRTAAPRRDLGSIRGAAADAPGRCGTGASGRLRQRRQSHPEPCHHSGEGVRRAHGARCAPRATCPTAPVRVIAAIRGRWLRRDRGRVLGNQGGPGRPDADHPRPSGPRNRLPSAVLYRRDLPRDRHHLRARTCADARPPQSGGLAARGRVSNEHGTRQASPAARPGGADGEPLLRFSSSARDSSSAVSPRSWRPTLDSSQPGFLPRR